MNYQCKLPCISLNGKRQVPQRDNWILIKGTFERMQSTVKSNQPDKMQAPLA